MTDDMVRRLMSAGLTKQQATSITAETLVDLFMDEDSKILIMEARQQVSEMRKIVNALKDDYRDLMKKIEEAAGILTAVTETQKEYGTITDEKAKTVVSLYAALLSMNNRTGANPSESVRNAGYVLYAFLGGQARRDITYYPSEDPIFPGTQNPDRKLKTV